MTATERRLTILLTAALTALDEQARRAAGYSSELRQLRAELDATSQGLLALHSELSSQQEQLEVARIAAEEASQAKAAFLASMTHEIRSPLNAMIGFTSLLQETRLTSEQADYAANLVSAGGHLKDLVDGILDLSKIESGQLDLDQVRFDLAACIEDAAALVGPLAEEKNLALAVLLAPGLPETVTGDPLRLRQVLVNLLSNALKFTSRGHVTIEAAALPGDGTGGCRLTFSVSDTGPGIPADELDRLFDPFTQLHAQAVEGPGGTGLGLAICRELTERMGGGMSVTSTLGTGSTFTATLSFGQADPASPGQADPASPGQAAPATAVARPLAGVGVLLVHPEGVVAEAARRHLAAWGAAVTVASSPADAASRADEWAGASLAVVGVTDPQAGSSETAPATALDSLALPIVGLTPLNWRRPPSFPALGWTVTAAPIRRARLREAVLAALGRVGPARTVSPAAPHAAVPGSRALRILVAEDEPGNQRAITQILGRLGHHTDLAGDGEQAVEALERGDYDLVLMDVHMPRLDGIAATREARARRPGHHPPIVALTASATAATRDACMRAGMDGFLTKPIQLDDLTGLLTGLDSHPPAPPAPTSPAPVPPAAAAPTPPAPTPPAPATPAPPAPTPSAPAASAAPTSPALVPAAPTPPAPAASPPQAPAGPGQPTQGRAEGDPATAVQVLYIDDNPALRSLAERILTRNPGLRVTTAGDGGTGLQLAATHRPGVILLDLNLPDMTGEAVLHQLRAEERTSDIPVIIVTGDTSPATVKHLADLGVADHLAKPFDATLLRAVIADTLAGQGVAQTTWTQVAGLPVLLQNHGRDVLST